MPEQCNDPNHNAPTKPERVACPDCGGRGEVLDAPSFGGSGTYWEPCPTCRPTPMSEPDFDQIARRIVKLRADLEDEDMAAMIAEQLRQVWNARGAAGLTAITTMPRYRSDIFDMPFESGVAEGRSDAYRAIKALDR